MDNDNYDFNSYNGPITISDDESDSPIIIPQRNMARSRQPPPPRPYPQLLYNSELPECYGTGNKAPAYFDSGSRMKDNADYDSVMMVESEPPYKAYRNNKTDVNNNSLPQHSFPQPHSDTQSTQYPQHPLDYNPANTQHQLHPPTWSMTGTRVQRGTSVRHPQLSLSPSEFPANLPVDTDMNARHKYNSTQVSTFASGQQLSGGLTNRSMSQNPSFKRPDNAGNLFGNSKGVQSSNFAHRSNDPNFNNSMPGSSNFTDRSTHQNTPRMGDEYGEGRDSMPTRMGDMYGEDRDSMLGVHSIGNMGYGYHQTTRGPARLFHTDEDTKPPRPPSPGYVHTIHLPPRDANFTSNLHQGQQPRANFTDKPHGANFADKNCNAHFTDQSRGASFTDQPQGTSFQQPGNANFPPNQQPASASIPDNSRAKFTDKCCGAGFSLGPQSLDQGPNQGGQGSSGSVAKRPRLLPYPKNSEEIFLMDKKEEKEDPRESQELKILVAQVDLASVWYHNMRAASIRTTTFLFQVVGRLESVRVKPLHKILILKHTTQSTALQCVFYEIDRKFPPIVIGSVIIVTGHMIGEKIIKIFDVEQIYESEIQKLHRLIFLSERQLKDMLAQRTDGKRGKINIV
ncbi:hypothetical protein M8J77_026395 [Diaphorina citri]|nr:hypothetical protein M8J77_026395 [Diaphorina citri]